jgi:hypothetical protein
MNKGIFFPLLILVMLLFSCGKNTETNLTVYLNVADNIVIAETVYDYPVRIMLMALKDSSLSKHHFAFFDSVYVLATPDINHLTFNFLGKVGPDTIYRSGTIYMITDGDPVVPGNRIILRFDKYFEDDHFILGQDTIVTERVSGNWIIFANNLHNGLLLHADSTATQYSKSRKIWVDASSWQTGSKSFRYFIKGSAMGLTTLGFSFSCETEDSLVLNASCPWILSGKLSMISPALEINPSQIDFIEGDNCNDRIRYNFFGNIYYVRKNKRSLNH